MSRVATVEFRFDPEPHTYIDLATGVELPHITGMLEATNWIDDTWFTEESSDRGIAIHKLTADYDLRALNPDDCKSSFRNYLLAYVKATTLMKQLEGLEVLTVEEPLVHPHYLYGGRPDREIVLRKKHALRGILEIKSGDPHKSHPIQTALQATLVSVQARIPAESIARFCLYVQKTGRFKLVEHVKRWDFDEAREVIRKCCQR